MNNLKESYKPPAETYTSIVPDQLNTDSKVTDGQEVKPQQNINTESNGTSEKSQ